MEFRCPSCGAAMRWDFDNQHLCCDYCGHHELPLSKNDVRKMTGSDAPDPATCPSCGAPLPEDPTTIAHVCPYCGDSLTMSHRIGQSRIVGIVPIKFTKRQMFDLLMRKYSNKLCLVPDIFSEDRLKEVQTEFIPYRVYDASGDVWYRGELTATKTTGDSETISTYDASLAAKVAYSDITILATDRVPDEVSLALEPFDLEEAMHFAEPYLAGSECHLPNTDPQGDYEKIDSEALDKSWKALYTPGRIACAYVTPDDEPLKHDYQRNITATARGTYLLPVYQYSYRMRNGRVLAYYLNAQTQEVFGQAPIDRGRVALASVSLAFMAASIVALALAVLLMIGG